MKRLLLSAWLLCFAVFAMAQAKYVFYFIGDGMGSNQVLAAEMYQAALEGKIGRVPLLMSQFPYSGQAATFSTSYGITDSVNHDSRNADRHFVGKNRLLLHAGKGYFRLPTHLLRGKVFLASCK